MFVLQQILQLDKNIVSIYQGENSRGQENIEGAWGFALEVHEKAGGLHHVFLILLSSIG